MQGSGLSFDIDSILKNVDSDITKELLRDIYTGSSTALFALKDAAIMIGSSEDDMITSNLKSKILLGGGIDVLVVCENCQANNIDLRRREVA